MCNLCPSSSSPTGPMTPAVTCLFCPITVKLGAQGDQGLVCQVQRRTRVLAILDLWTTRGKPSFLRVSPPGMTPHSPSFPVFSEGCVSSAPSAPRAPQGHPICCSLPGSSSSTTSSGLPHPECQPGSSHLWEALGRGRVGPCCPYLSPICPGVVRSSLLSVAEKQQSSQNPGVLGDLGFIPDVSLMSCVTR